MRRLLVLAALLALAACAAHPLVTLADRCDELAAAVNTAAAARAQGKLSPGQVQLVLDTEPIAEALCDKTNPPMDVTSAIGRVAAQLERITLLNAGVR